MKIDFAGVPPFQEIQRASVAGAWQKRRTERFGNYMPREAALRLARRWNITPGSARYNSGLMDGLDELDVYIKEAMGIRKISRDEAIEFVWNNLRESYIEQNRRIESSQDLLHWWLSDWLVSPS